MCPSCGGGTIRETARFSTAASHLSAGKRYASVPGGPDPGSQTAIAERSRGVLHLSTRSVRNLRAEIEMYDRLAALGHKASARRRARAHAATDHSGSHATTTLRSRASLCQPEIPHLRTSALPVARIAGSANRNQPGGRPLQPETHDEYSPPPPPHVPPNTLPKHTPPPP